MTNPVPGYKITTPFGVSGKWQAGYHTGDDYAAPGGARVVATRGGKVVKTGWGGDYGNQIIIDTDGIRHSYNHLSRIHVEVGQKVYQEQHIGAVGTTGRSTGTHLHYEERVSPYAYMNHRKPLFNMEVPKSGWLFPAGHKVYQKYLKVDGHEQNADRTSDSIKALQEMLNRHKMVGGTNLPITGKYWKGTDKEVRLCQMLHRTEWGQINVDSVMESNVGPKQFEHLRRATGAPYVWVAETDKPAPEPEKPVPGPREWKPGDAWHPAASLVALRDEVDAKWPGRNRSKDGTIGDARHMTSKSEHNPVGHEYGPEHGTFGAVHAIDITHDPETDPAMGMTIVDAVKGDPRVWYIIHNGHIWSKTYGWEQRSYTGSDPHESHVHISLAADDPESALRNEKDTSEWLGSGLPQPEPEPLPEYVSIDVLAAWIEKARKKGIDLPDL